MGAGGGFAGGGGGGGGGGGLEGLGKVAGIAALDLDDAAEIGGQIIEGVVNVVGALGG